MQDITPLPIARSDSGPKGDYGSVPVKKPTAVSLTQQVDNPISTDSRTLAQFASEAEMDKILDDINKKVQAANDSKPTGKSRFSFLKRQPKTAAQPAAKPAKEIPAGPQKNKRSNKLVIATAIIVGLALTGFAFAAFAKQNVAPTQQPDQQTANQTNSSVTTDDLDKLSSDIQSQTNNLSAEEDFTSDDLSDSAIGL